jgi:hypothetical protein
VAVVVALDILTDLTLPTDKLFKVQDKHLVAKLILIEQPLARAVMTLIRELLPMDPRDVL